MISRPFLKVPSTAPPIGVGRPSEAGGGGSPGGSQPWLGANYWSRTGGPLMWRSFDEDVVRGELAVLERHGLNLTRSFFYWPDFMPAPNTIDPDVVDHYERFLDICAEVGMSTIPTFIVGHMSGENWDVPWRGDRDLYADGWMLAQQAWFIRGMTARFRHRPEIAGWLISNEMPLYAGPTTPEYASSWGELMVQAVRAGGGRQPVSLGDGAWGIEVTGEDNGFRLRDIAPTVDFIGPHVYPMTDDIVRQHLSAAFNCEMSHFGRPVILEEFGVTTDFASEANAGVYYRQVLHNSLLAGATGWIAWNNTDFDLVDQDPYRHHPFELHFGLTTVKGEPKAPLLELESFRRVLDAVDLPNCERGPSDTALVVPSYLDDGYPFTDARDRRAVRDILLQSYVAAKEADLAPVLCRELDGVPDAALILAGSTKQLLGPTWSALERRAFSGATVYASYWPGSAGVQRGAWVPGLGELFGVTHRLRYGLIDPVEGGSVRWTVTEGFGGLGAGDTLSFQVAGSAHAGVFLPLDPAGARVLALDEQDRPALLERRLGRGRMILATSPVEYWAASRPCANPDDTYKLYGALARMAGVRLRAGVDRPDVLLDCLQHSDGTIYVWLISESEEELKVAPELHVPGEPVDLLNDEPATAVTIPPYGVRVLRLAPTLR